MYWTDSNDEHNDYIERRSFGISAQVCFFLIIYLLYCDIIDENNDYIERCSFGMFKLFIIYVLNCDITDENNDYIERCSLGIFTFCSSRGKTVAKMQACVTIEESVTQYVDHCVRAGVFSLLCLFDSFQEVLIFLIATASMA